MRALNFTILFLMMFGVSINAFGQWSDSQELVTKKFKFNMNEAAADCAGGSLYEGSQTEIECNVPLFDVPEEGSFSDGQFIGDEYFDIKVYATTAGLTFIFRDYGIEYLDLLNEIIDYYDNNEVFYELTYEGPDF